MTRNFNCASCSAPLEFEGTPTQKCRYCGSTVIAPTELFYASSATPFGDFSSLTGKALKIAEIDQLIHEGKKLEAIKVFRETFGVGLAEAKEAIERMERGESVDISGMQVTRSRKATAADIEKVKKIGFTIGGSILASIVVSLVVIGAVTAAVIYFTWSALDNRIPTGAQVTRDEPSSPNPRPASEPESMDVLQIGGKGNGAGKFTDNRHVGVDGDGNIYSSDYSPHRIQVFDAGGKFVTQWAPESGSNLYDLAVDTDGNVYIANDKGVFKHEGATGKLLAKAALSPRGIALTWDKKLLVTTRQSIMLLNGSLQTVKEWKDVASAANSTFGFEKIATDGGEFIYALDIKENDICKFSGEGKFLDRFSSHSTAPHAIAVDPQGRLVVSDTSYIYFLDPQTGEKLKTMKTTQAFGVAFDQEGHLFVASRPYVIKYRLGF
jgi:streptogramin lyase